MSETTTDTLAEIEGQAAEYTPPEGWRLLQVGELVQNGDQWLRCDDQRRFASIAIGQTVMSPNRYIRRIEPEPDRIITPDDVSAEALAGVWDQGKAERQIAELRSEVSHVQRLLGDERRRFAELETLASDLRAVNTAQEKGINSAARDKADLQHRLDTVAAEWALQAETIRGLQTQLEAVKAELASVAADRQRLQIELDAAQQVPADSPELRQLRADLEQVTRERDEYRYAHDVLVKDANTVHERTKAMTVEAIAEWLEPVRLVDNPNLANETLQHLPQIMRTLTGLADTED